MAESNIAKKIGYKQAFKAITIGLAIAYLIMASMAGAAWLFQVEFAPPILFAVFMMYVSAYFLGGLVGDWIINKKRSAILVGILGGFVIVWSATFFGSLIGFFKQGLGNSDSYSNPFYDYIYKPLGLVTMFGFIPIILVGIWFGLSIKKRGRQAAALKFP